MPASDRFPAVQVELRRLTKRFGRTVSVAGVSFVIDRGEFFTLLGPSGCGKTTTLRMIAGLLRPDDGEILFDGRPVTTTPPWRRNIGMVFQNYALWPHMTVADNVAFGLVERRTPRPEVRDRVEEALGLVGLAAFAGRLPSQLSGGQQQRVALARAIVVRPSLLLLDEPLSNLDARLRVQMRNELVRLQRQLGITTIYVTHDQEEALMLSTRIAVMNAGRVEQLGRPEDIYERPASEFVADFLGGANFLDGVVRAVRPDRVEVELEDGVVVAASTERNEGFVPGEAVTACLRPEGLSVMDGAGGERSSSGLTGVLRLRTYLGSAIGCEIELQSGRILRAQGQLAELGGAEAGSVVTIRPSPEQILLFKRGDPGPAYFSTHPR